MRQMEMAEVRFGELAAMCRARFPDSLITHGWFDVRLKHPRNYAHGEDLCLVDRWPSPTIVYCLSRPPAPADPHFALGCLWSQQDARTSTRFVTSANRRLHIHQSFMCAVDTHCAEQLDRYYTRLGKVVKRTSSNSFWMDEKDYSVLGAEIAAPDGYRFDVLRPDEAETVDQVWEHRHPGSVEHIRNRIRHLPNVCLRETATGHGQLAAFEILESDFGFMNHLYTFAAHRRRGLATKVELKLAQILVTQNTVPFKFVVLQNESGTAITEKCPYWTKAPEQCDFIQVYSKE